MKKFKLLIIIGVLAALLSACGSSSLVGRWEIGLKNAASGDGFTETLEFFSDGTYDFGGYGSGTYSTDGNRLKLDKRYGYSTTYTYAISGSKLKLENDNTNITLQKVK